MLHTIGSRVRFLRLQANLTVDMLINELKIPQYDEDNQLIGTKSVTKGTIGNLENDRNRANIDLIMAISQFYGISTDWILFGREHEGKKMTSQSEEELEPYYDSTREEVIRELEQAINKLKKGN